jgi:pyridoxamine 5'-phosphate oxidase
VPGGDEHARDPGVRIARPPHWGGYQLWAEAVELWVEGSARIHDRARWVRTLRPQDDGFEPGPWSVSRLQP